MGPLVVVEPEVGTQFPTGLDSAGVGFQVHLFVLHRAPQPLHEDVVAVASLPIHADLHLVVLQRLGELPAGELAPLLGVEHLRPALPQRILQSIDAEFSLQGVGQSPGHQVPAVQVHDGHQVEESPDHVQVGDVGRPHLVGLGDLVLFQQIGVDGYSGAGRLVREPRQIACNPMIRINRCTRFRPMCLPSLRRYSRALTNSFSPITFSSRTLTCLSKPFRMILALSRIFPTWPSMASADFVISSKPPT